MHWAQYAAKMLCDREGQPPVCASGITPSGEFHLGHLREILTAEMIHESCIEFIDEEQLNLKSKYIFIVDSMDPLRGVYDFLSPSYERYIGHPLAFIPAPGPDGEPGVDPKKGGESYAEHFLNDFIDALKQLGIDFSSDSDGYELIMNHETYANGEFSEFIDAAITHRDKIREKIEEISGRELPEDWYPYNPVGHDGSMDGVVVTRYERPYVYWEDSQGIEGKSDIAKAEGKLPWRVDWAARWIIHRITCEPAGKDHGASGGSYDTGRPICKILCEEMEGIHFEPPKKMVYEWIQLKGMGPMSSSAGVSIGPLEALKIVPPEILRYLIARTRMARHIDFDTGGKLFEIADEYETMRQFITRNAKETEEHFESNYGDGRKFELYQKDKTAIVLSQVKGELDDDIGAVGFRHLAMLAQIKKSDADVWKSLNETNHIEGSPHEGLEDRLRRMRSWVEGPHFPEEDKIEIQFQFDNNGSDKLVDGGSIFLHEFSASLEKCNWNEKEIDDCIRVAADSTGLQIKDAYSTLYRVILCKTFGPKASSLIFHIGQSQIRSLIESVKIDSTGLE